MPIGATGLLQNSGGLNGPIELFGTKPLSEPSHVWWNRGMLATIGDRWIMLSVAKLLCQAVQARSHDSLGCQSFLKAAKTVFFLATVVAKKGWGEPFVLEALIEDRGV